MMLKKKENFNKILVEQSLNTPAIFWDIPKDSLSSLSSEALLERILNYGNLEQFKTLVKYKEEFKSVYTKLLNKKRCNLNKKVINFTNIYLERTT